MMTQEYSQLFEEREKSIEKVAGAISKLAPEMVEQMLRAGKGTLKGIESSHGLSGINRPPVVGLMDSLKRTQDLGKAVSEIDLLQELASKNRGSLKSTFLDIFDMGSQSNPFQLMRQARNKAYRPLGAGYNYPGSSLKQMAGTEIESSIFKSLARQSDIPEVNEYAKYLLNTRNERGSELKNLVRQVKDDYLNGKDPVIMVKDQHGRYNNISLHLDKPIASYNGSPAINIGKTHGIDGIESFNKQHYRLQDNYNKAWSRAQDATDPKLIAAKDEFARSKDFGHQFEDKLKLMSSSANKQINKAEFTLDDLDSVDKVRAFLRSPHLKREHRLLPEGTHEQYTGYILRELGQTNGSPEAVKLKLTQILDDMAQSPEGTNFLQSLQFKRYSGEDMKHLMESLKGTKNAVMAEGTRTGLDAAGLIGLPAIGLYGGYKAVQKHGKLLDDDSRDTKQLHHSPMRL